MLSSAGRVGRAESKTARFETLRLEETVESLGQHRLVQSATGTVEVKLARNCCLLSIPFSQILCFGKIAQGDTFDSSIGSTMILTKLLIAHSRGLRASGPTLG